MDIRLLIRRFYLSFLLLVFLLFFPQLNAQKFDIRSYNIQDGLAQSQVQFITQDYLGYIWLATTDGLSRFDGISFKNYTLHDGLAENDITSGLLDSDGNLWFGHRHGAITLHTFPEDTFHIIRLWEDRKRSAEITSMIQARDGSLWITTQGEGVYHYTGDHFTRLDLDTLSSWNYYSIVEIEDDILLLGTSRGIVLSQPRTGKYKLLGKKNGLPDSYVYFMNKDYEGRVWIGLTNGRVYVYDPARQSADEPLTFHPYVFSSTPPSANVTSVLLDQHHNIWIGYYGDGVYRVSTGKDIYDIRDVQHITVQNGLNTNLIFSLFEDREGNIWLGTDGGGANIFKGDVFYIYTRSEGLIDNSIWEIFEDHLGNYWIATQFGVTRLKFSPNSYKPLEVEQFDTTAGLPPGVISITEDDRGLLYFGSFGKGLVQFNPQSRKFLPLKKATGLTDPNLLKNILHMRRDSSGNIWIATYGEGVFKYNPARNKFTNIREGNGLCSDYIRYIYIDHSENIWVATEGGGICRFDGEKFTVFNQENGFSSPSASNMTEDNHGNLWIGTPGFGLYKFDGVNFQRFTTQDGLSGDFIYLTVSDEEGNIWIGTSRGVDKITPAPFHITHFGQEEGFLTVETNENAVLRDSKDKLWFGTIGGAILYNDKADVRNQVPPLLHITNLKLFLRETPIPPDHQFKYNQNHLTFEFIGISLSNPQKVRYQYQLEGFDETWSPITSERFATYSNIPPGDYIFKVKAANSDGIWTEQPVSFTFTIRPPFWQTWWFELLMFLGFVGLIYGISNYRIRSVAKRQKYLEEKVLERTQDLQAEKEKVEKAYQALQESEQKFREYTESSSSAIFIQQNNKFLYVNAALERLTGYRREELLGQDILRVVHPDMIDFVEEKIKQRKSGNRDYVRYELKIVRKDGEERWVDLTTCLIDYEGSWAVLGNAFDITERKLAEEALAEHEARLRTLIDSMPDFVCFKDAEGRWMEANTYAIKLFELENTDFHYKSDRELAEEATFYKEAFLTCVTSDEEAWKRKTPSRFEEVVPQRDGSKRIFDVIKVPIFKPDGSRKALVVIGRDITERKRAEEALSSEKEFLAVTLRSIGDGVISTNRAGEVVLMNAEAERLTGISQEEAIGKHLSDILFLKDASSGERLANPVDEIILEGKNYLQNQNTILVSRTGEEFFISSSGAPIRFQENEIVGMVLVLRDITEKQQLQEELFKAQKLESVGILAGGIAHDFNNILTAILGNISLAKLHSQESQVKQWLDEAETATSRAKELTQQLLTFSKGGTPILEDIPIGQLIHQTVRFILRGSPVGCDFQIADDLWAVRADEGQISQVLNNLVINAQQAMPSGGVITVSAENVEIKPDSVSPLQPGPYVKITIADEGIGIPENIIDKIFDPYFTTKQAGSGLGLATTYSIIKKHQGHIEVESKVNEGTRFYIYLPAVKKQVQEKKAEPQSVQRGDARILVMDDDPMVRDVLGKLLGVAGYQVEFAEDGREALEIYQQAMDKGERFDLVIMDLTIPGGMGGKETIPRLLELDPDAKAIVSSGYSNDPVMAHYREYGFQGIVKKPYRLKEVTQAVQEVLSMGAPVKEQVE